MIRNMGAPRTLLELLLLSDFGRLYPDRAYELAMAAEASLATWGPDAKKPDEPRQRLKREAA